MKTLNNMLSEQLKDEEFRKEYEEIQPEMDVIRAIVDARTSQNLTQKELAERTGINQADISKLENGTKNPSVNLLKRLADGKSRDFPFGEVSIFVYRFRNSQKGEYFYETLWLSQNKYEGAAPGSWLVK